MLRCSLIAGVFAATVALSACGASEAVPPTSAPVETPPTVTPEAASTTSAPVQMSRVSTSSDYVRVMDQRLCQWLLCQANSYPVR